MEVESGLGHDGRHTLYMYIKPADVLVPNWVLGKPAAFDITITSLLTPITLHEASVASGSTAQVTENKKLASNDAKCSELGFLWQWKQGAQNTFARLASILSISSLHCSKA